MLTCGTKRNIQELLKKMPSVEQLEDAVQVLSQRVAQLERNGSGGHATANSAPGGAAVSLEELLQLREAIVADRTEAQKLGTKYRDLQDENTRLKAAVAKHEYRIKILLRNAQN